MEAQTVSVRTLRVLRGPNRHAYMPVLEVVLDIGPYEEHSSTAFPGVVERLTTWLPGLYTHECSVGRPGGFVERLQRGTYLAHIIEHVTLELQSMMGFDVSFGRARTTNEHGVYMIVVAYKEEEPAKAALHTALELTLAAMHDMPFDHEGTIERLRTLADEYRLGPSTAAIVDAARKRHIPVLRLMPTGSLVQLGYGVHQRRIQAAETSLTSAIAVDMCQDKALTNRMLRAVAVPVPEGITVVSADAAWEAALEIGLPVVVKPEDGNQGKGVSVNLKSEAEVRAAFDIARFFGSSILVEQYIEGYDYRLLVVNGELVAAARRDPAQVIGDGQHTVAELVGIVNQDPRRRSGHSSILTRIELDEVANLVLAQQGFTVDSVPSAGHIVNLRTNCNLSTGGTATDVTAEVHPANARVARLAAQILALDIAGIDIVCRDIRRPLSEQGGAIVEVNAAPGLRMHLAPAVGQPRDVGTPIVDMLFPNDTSARIPIIAVTGTNGKTTVTRLIAHIHATAHKVVGMTCTDGVYIDGERVMSGDCSGPKSAQAVLLHPRVEVAVLETARGGILREGLAFDSCSVGVVTNISSDHLGIGGITTLEELAQVKQVVVEVARKDGAAVLNADDPLVAEMAAVTDAPVIYFSERPQQHIVAAHLTNGGRCVTVDNGVIVLAQADERTNLIELSRVPFTHQGTIGFQVQNALAAVAAAWAAGLNPAIIARALTTFATDERLVPGRFNMLDVAGVQVILDYGHNVGALQAIGKACSNLGQRRTVLVMGLPGDRRDDDLYATLDATLTFVDEYILYDLDDLRGRKPRELPQMLIQRLAEKRPSTIAARQHEGILRGWQHVKPGDRLVVIVDEVDEAIEQVQALVAAVTADAACTAPITRERALGEANRATS
jgi:cyanophycin synthetase